MKNFVPKEEESFLTELRNMVSKDLKNLSQKPPISSKNASPLPKKSSKRNFDCLLKTELPPSHIGPNEEVHFLSHAEQALLNSTEPLSLNTSDEIEFRNVRGIWVNKDEVLGWRGEIPIDEYPINIDINPEIFCKKTSLSLNYIQELAIRYLKPPTPPPPGEIIIRQEANKGTKPAPPLIIRQLPARPETPEPMVIREMPPNPPQSIGRKLITISGKTLPPPPRKVIIER